MTLTQKGDALFTSRNGEEIEVRVVYARPLRAPDSEIALVAKKSKEELAWFSSADQLPAALRPLVEEALAKRYPIATITAVLDAQVRSGQRLVTVETDLGPRSFNLKEPGKNLTKIGHDGLLIRDAMGNRYRLPSLSALDDGSQEIFERVT
ncbi:MAG: DUF1854 domain-containing protein [Verrucomicrobiota bacterium]